MKVAVMIGLFLTLAVPGSHAQQSASLVGYADVEFIISQLTSAKELEETLKATHTRLQNEYQLKSDQLRKDYDDFVQGMNTMADSAVARKQAELQQASNELQQMEANAQRTIENQQRLLLAPVYLRVRNAIEAIAAQNGITIVLNKKVSGVELLLFKTEAYDLSPLVIEALNAETK